MGNPAEETYCHPNTLNIRMHRKVCQLIIERLFWAEPPFPGPPGQPGCPAATAQSPRHMVRGPWMGSLCVPGTRIETMNRAGLLRPPMLAARKGWGEGWGALPRSLGENPPQPLPPYAPFPPREERAGERRPPSLCHPTPEPVGLG